MGEISKVSKRSYKNKNCAILFSCDEETYRSIIDWIRPIQGVHIYYTKSSTLRLIIEERPF